MAEKTQLKEIKIRVTPELHANILKLSDRRGEPITRTVVHLIEAGFDWLRTRFEVVK